MRSLTCGALAILAIADVSTATAADLDYGVLRGPDYEPEVAAIDWSGFYIGAHGGYTSGAFGLKDTSRDIVANALRRTVIEDELAVSGLLAPRDVRKGGGSFGGYAGYNVQYDELVLGIEVDYTSANLNGVTGDAAGRQAGTTDGFQNVYRLNQTSNTKIRDYGTIRARAGYALGNFLPFVTGGLAIGRASISDTVGIQTFGYNQVTYAANQALTDGAKPAYVNNYGYSYFDQSNPENSIVAPMEYYGRKKTKVMAGVALGAGLEYAITPNFLLRGEYQYVLFNDFDGHKANLNTVRAGAAYKF